MSLLQEQANKFSLLLLHAKQSTSLIELIVFIGLFELFHKKNKIFNIYTKKRQKLN